MDVASTSGVVSGANVKGFLHPLHWPAPASPSGLFVGVPKNFVAAAGVDDAEAGECCGSNFARVTGGEDDGDLSAASMVQQKKQLK